MIADDEWNEWLHEVVVVLNTHEKLFKNVLDFLGKIKSLIEDCSRAYTGMFVLDTLHQTVTEVGGNKGENPQFVADIQALQVGWNKIMETVREPRKILIATKCLEFLAARYKEFEYVATIEELQGEDKVALWAKISKRFIDSPSYQKFTGDLLVEMTKY